MFDELHYMRDILQLTINPVEFNSYLIVGCTPPISILKILFRRNILHFNRNSFHLFKH